MDTKELAELMSKELVWGERNDGSKFASLKDGSPEWMHDVIRAAHEDSFPDDTIYEFVDRAVNAFAESEDPNDAIYEVEPDVYTSDLTEWLHRRADHVFYLTQALEESETRDGFQALQAAQGIQIREVAELTLSALQEVAEKWEEPEIEEE